MESSNQIEKSSLHDWVEMETRPIDLVASWETLCDVYRALEFTDVINDAMRMEEFKWIVHEMNKHLTRARKTLLTCKDAMATKEALEKMFTTGNTNIMGRRDLAYQKLRQRWVQQMLIQLEMLIEEQQKEEEDYGSEY